MWYTIQTRRCRSRARALHARMTLSRMGLRTLTMQKPQRVRFAEAARGVMVWSGAVPLFARRACARHALCRRTGLLRTLNHAKTRRCGYFLLRAVSRQKEGKDEMIISASRRTDIPACYGQWMMARLRERCLCRTRITRRVSAAWPFRQAMWTASFFGRKTPRPCCRCWMSSTHLDTNTILNIQ